MKPSTDAPASLPQSQSYPGSTLVSAGPSSHQRSRNLFTTNGLHHGPNKPTLNEVTPSSVPQLVHPASSSSSSGSSSRGVTSPEPPSLLQKFRKTLSWRFNSSSSSTNTGASLDSAKQQNGAGQSNTQLLTPGGNSADSDRNVENFVGQGHRNKEHLGLDGYVETFSGQFGGTYCVRRL